MYTILRIATTVALSIVTVSTTATAVAGSVPSFQGLGDLPDGFFLSEANGVSADGSVVVGRGASASGLEAFRWTANGGMVGLGDLPGGVFQSNASGVSADGSVVVGWGWLGQESSSREAFRWTTGDGMVGLGGSRSLARSASADGSVVVGVRGSEAFRWTAGGGMIGLGDLPGGPFSSGALGVSADGSVVVGGSRTGPFAQAEAFRWTAAGGMVGLGNLPGRRFASTAFAISADGSTIVGDSGGDDPAEAFLWTSSGGMIGLGNLPDGILNSRALGVSANGSTVVGRSSGNFTNSVAFIWDAARGMRSLPDLLVDNFGLDLTGWTLDEARGVSADGLTVVGVGTNPSGFQEAWIATIPEPGTLTLFALAGIVALRRRRR